MENTYQNPILPGFYPDPSICRVGDDYYMVTSTFAYFPGVPIFHSKDLVHWVQIGNVLDREEQLPLHHAGVSQGIFAPTIRYSDGIFYMITTNVSGGGNFVVTATDPAGPWSQAHWIKNAPGIDPSLYFEKGKAYYQGTRELENGRYYGDNEIYLQELCLETWQLVGQRYTIYHTALKNAVWPESPHIYKIGDWYYLLHAEGGTSWDHACMIARSKVLTDYYQGWKSNPMLTHRHLGKKYPIQFVGHGDFVNTPNGDWHMVLLAVRKQHGAENLGRETFMVPIVFEEGWPIANYGIGLVEEYHPLPLPTKLSDKKPVSSWIHLRNPIKDNYIFHKNGNVSLKLAQSKIHEKQQVSFYCTRQIHHNFEANVDIIHIDNKDGYAGLVLFQNEEFNYAIMVGNGKIIAMKGTEVLKEIVGTATNLKFIQNQQHVAMYYDGKILLDNLDGKILSTSVAGGFVGTTIGMYAHGNDEGFATFSNFSYTGL